MVVALVALQLAGLVGLYVVLRRRIDRHSHSTYELAQLRTQVAELIAELNGTAERNVTLLEDRIECMNELLEQADRCAALAHPEGVHRRTEPQPEHAGSAQERSAQVIHLRKLGFSSAVIADRLATSQAEVELIVNLATDRHSVLTRPGVRKPAPHAIEA